MFVVLKLVNGATTLVVGPFPSKNESRAYVARALDAVCPAGETWAIKLVEPPNF